MTSSYNNNNLTDVWSYTYKLACLRNVLLDIPLSVTFKVTKVQIFLNKTNDEKTIQEN